jgi:ferredoxin, 2Fe-2S
MTHSDVLRADVQTVRVRYIDPSGKTHDLKAREGDTLMAVATSNLVPGIGGDCGGNCACGTCLIRLDAFVLKGLPPPDAIERELLDFVGDAAADHRLGCQIKLTPALDGLTVTVVGANA